MQPKYYYYLINIVYIVLVVSLLTNGVDSRATRQILGQFENLIAKALPPNLPANLRELSGYADRLTGEALTVPRLDLRNEVSKFFSFADISTMSYAKKQYAATLRNPMTSQARSYVKSALRSVNHRPARFLPGGDNFIDVNEIYGTSQDFFESDIVLTEQQSQQIYGNAGRKKRQTYTMYGAQALWTMPIAYQFDPSITSTAQVAITKAMNFWQANTCMRFTNNPSATDKLYFFAGQGCYAGVGRPLNGGQQGISIGSGCEQVPITTHEIGHCFGFFHTQNRFDRDSNIFVNYDNIPQAYYPNYLKLTQQENNNFNQLYDVGSVMHYDQYGFAKNASIPTLVANDTRYQNSMGQGQPSFIDVYLINILYGCTAMCPTNPCENGGYPNPNNCNQCLCPSCFGGPTCTNIYPNYDPYNSPHSDHVSINAGATPVSYSMNVTGAPMNINSDYKVKNLWIQGPVGKRIQLQINAFALSVLCTTSCSFGGLEMKLKADRTLSGVRACCSFDVSKYFISETNFLAISLYSRYGPFGVIFKYNYVS